MWLLVTVLVYLQRSLLPQQIKQQHDTASHTGTILM
jgi:hypothetical protein